MPSTLLFKYEDDAGRIHPIRLTTAISTVGGQTPPTGAINDGVSARYNIPRARTGLHARYVLASRVFGTPPNVLRRYQRFPVLNKAALGTSPFVKGGTFDYNSFTWTVTEVVAETQK